MEWNEIYWHTSYLRLMIYCGLLDENLYKIKNTNSILVGFQSNQDNRQSSKKIISSNYCIHTVVPPDDGHRYARNMYSLTKYTKSKLCIN
jgi:hypothetical protein